MVAPIVLLVLMWLVFGVITSRLSGCGTPRPYDMCFGPFAYLLWDDLSPENKTPVPLKSDGESNGDELNYDSLVTVQSKIESGLPIQIVALKMEKTGLQPSMIYSLLKTATGSRYRRCQDCGYVYGDCFSTCQHCGEQVSLSDTDRFTEEDYASCAEIVLSNEV